MILIKNYQFLLNLFFFELAFNVMFHDVLVGKGGFEEYKNGILT